jgi:transcriptional/translational regulatory protein YebC/TACO1
LIDGGALEFERDEDLLTVYTEFTDFGKMSSKLEEINIEPKNAEVQRIPLNTTELPIDQGIQILNLIDKFEDDDDVQNVYHTLEVTDELIESFEEY